jgi:hypothetical protein
MLGPYIKSIEIAAHNCEAFIKGLDDEAVNKKIENLLGFEVFAESDYTRFDQSQGYDTLHGIQNRIITRAYSNDAFFQSLMTRTVNIKGCTRLGIFYIADTRASGDAHTSLGNGLTNYFFTWLALRKLPRHSWKSYHEGDDGIIGIKPQFVNQAVYNLEFLQCLGFSLKLRTATSMPSLCFVGRRFFCSYGTIKTAPDLKRLLAKFHITSSPLQGELILAAKSFSYFIKYRRSPVVTHLTYHTIRCIASKLKVHAPKKFTDALINSMGRWQYDTTNMHHEFAAKSKLMPDKDLPQILLSLMKWEPPDLDGRVVANLYDGVDYKTQIEFENMVSNWDYLPAEVPDLFRFDEATTGPEVTVNGAPYAHG